MGYEKRLNEIPSASFSLPLNDPKNAECKPLNYVEITDDFSGEYIGLFRILPALTQKNEGTNTISYTLEHVLGTLLDDVLFRYHQNTGLTTRQNIEYLLGKQSTANWRLGRCDFALKFDYKWENENGLIGCIFAITEPFVDPFEWTYDTSTYPWTLNLVKAESTPTCEIRFGKNLIGIEREVDPSNITNRIYPLGYGEGVNQLDITKVNGGKEYIEDANSIATYGLKSYIYADTTVEKADLLLANAQALLKQSTTPKVTYKVAAADLSVITGVDVDKLRCGRVVHVVDPDVGTFEARIVSESKGDMTGAPGNIELEIANKLEDIADTIGGLERAREVNQVYAQGATSIDSHDFADNADPTNPAEFRFYLPDELVRINKLTLTFDVTQYRAYSKSALGGGAFVSSTEAGGATVRSTSSGGGITKSSTSGGGVSKSTASGGGTTQTTASGGNHRHQVLAGTSLLLPGDQRPFQARTGDGSIIQVVLEATSGANIMTFTADGDHTHSVTVPSHTHSFDVPNHSHDVTIPNHSHEVDIPAHQHGINIPNHVHAIDFGIYKLPNVPTKVTIKVDGKTIPYTDTSGDLLDLIPYLELDDQKRVRRGWHTVSIAPNDLGRVSAQLTNQFFMQSRGGGDY
ncbi:phage tail spike protein [Heyndrickxia sporothermodurans]|nr:phage tail spike protein [Heyndrickxia sporothermodurans]MED3697930.1 phage tail spike protein [Heyndrickxia sporothermodurans]